ncbi:MAG: hypothetical protein O3B95_09560 [Chloroflexi bacterium]|nr:hypothetical protein [Chloroflexota bacterium]
MGRLRLVSVLAIAAIFVAGAVACSRSSDEPTTLSGTKSPGSTQTPQLQTPTDPSNDRPSTGGDASNGIAVGEPVPGFSPVNLPEGKITFSVKTPAITPANAPVYLSIVDLTGGTDKHIRMKNLGDGQYETQASVQAGAMIRYGSVRTQCSRAI